MLTKIINLREETHYETMEQEKCAVEEMPAGYADGLMAASPVWALIVVVIAGIALSMIMSNITVKLFKLDKEAR